MEATLEAQINSTNRNFFSLGFGDIFLTLSVPLLYFVVLIFAMPVYKRLLKTVESKKTSKIVISMIRFVMIISYTLLWIALIVFVLLRMNLKEQILNFLKTASEISTEQISKFVVIHGLYVFKIVILVISSLEFWAVIITIIICKLFISYISSLEESQSTVHSYLRDYVFSKWIELIKIIKPKVKELKNAINYINGGLSIFAPVILCSSLILVSQLGGIAYILSFTKISYFYILPLMFLADWAFNFSIVFTKFFVYLSVEKKNERNINIFDVFKYLPELCSHSFQLTIVAAVQIAARTFGKFKFLGNSEIFKPIKNFCIKYNYLFGFLFRCLEFYSEEKLLYSSFQANLKSNEKGSDDESIEQVDRIFREKDVFLFFVSGFKKVILRYSLHYAILTTALIRQEGITQMTEFSFFINNESSRMIFSLFKNLSIGTTTLVFIYLIFTHYILAVESAYIINKKKPHIQ